jgi:hypothetical protein
MKSLDRNQQSQSCHSAEHRWYAKQLLEEQRDGKMSSEVTMSLETLIGGLSRDEQIVAMELLWKRLTTEVPATAPPEWHRSVVAERVAAIERGEDALSDWADVKKRLADRLR